MAIPSRQIGWSTEDNLLWQISKQLEQLTNVTAKACANNAPTYKVFTALLTQTGGSQYQEANGGDPLFKGYTYLILLNGDSGNDADLSEFGAPNNDVGTYFICTKDGNAPFPSTGNLNLQRDLGAPVATVLENTIGNIWFSYNGVGEYSLNIENQFNVIKTYYQCSKVTSTIFIGASFEDIGNLPLDIYSRDSSNQGIDDILFNTPIEIRVYN